MAIKRITKFNARIERVSELADLLKSVLPVIKDSPGCISCTLMQASESPEQLIVIEEWESIPAHQASLQSIPPDKMRQALGFLAGLPEADYYKTLA
jgi:quinol monooxygenase YgiN